MEIRSGEIYMLTNSVTGLRYIGQTIRGIEKRWKAHVYSAITEKKNCRKIEEAIRKDGVNSFTREVLLICNIGDLNYYEKLFIDRYNTLNPLGYNMMTGGCNGRTHSEETKMRMSQTRTGKHHSEETRLKMSQSQSGLKKSEIAKINIGKSSRGRNMSAEVKERLDKFLNKMGINELPMYMYYKVNKRKDMLGNTVDGFTVSIDKHHKKYFVSKLPLEENFDLAQDYISSIKRLPATQSVAQGIV